MSKSFIFLGGLSFLFGVDGIVKTQIVNYEKKMWILVIKFSLLVKKTLLNYWIMKISIC